MNRDLKASKEAVKAYRYLNVDFNKRRKNAGSYQYLSEAQAKAKTFSLCRNNTL